MDRENRLAKLAEINQCPTCGTAQSPTWSQRRAKEDVAALAELTGLHTAVKVWLDEQALAIVRAGEPAGVDGLTAALFRYSALVEHLELAVRYVGDVLAARAAHKPAPSVAARFNRTVAGL